MARAKTRALMVSSFLDQPLLLLSQADPYRVRDMLENILVLAGIGAGKSSGIGKAIRRAMMSAGFGGLVLVAKPDEVKTWIDDARACGRLGSVILFDGSQGYNFIAHELTKHGPEGINAIIEYIMRILEMIRVAMGDTGRSSEPFWTNSQRQLLRMILPILYAAYGTVRIEDIIEFITTAPTSSAQLQDEAWRQSSFMWRTMLKARTAPAVPINPDTFASIASFWKDQFAQQDQKLRTNVTATISTSLDRFTHGRLNKAFCQKTTIVPELIFGGAIIILDMSALVWNEDGVIAQQLFKFATQRAILSRNSLGPEQAARPVFIYADEAQTFLNSYDAEFLSLSRSSRCASIYMSQSLPTIYAKIGGENAKYTGDMLLAQFGTKVFGNNSCPETNRFASETIGRTLHRRRTYNEGENQGWSTGSSMGEGTNTSSSSGGSITSDGQGNTSRSVNFGESSGYSDNRGRNRGRNYGQSISAGYSETMDAEIEAAEFSRSLKTGGPANEGVVTAVWFQAGRSFSATGRNWLIASFKQ